MKKLMAILAVLVLLVPGAAMAGYIRMFLDTPETLQDAEGNDYTAYVIGPKTFPQDKTIVLASSGGKDLFMVHLASRVLADAALDRPEYIASSYLELVFKALAHEAHIQTAAPGDYKAVYYTIVKKLPCLVWDGGLDGEGNQIKTVGTPTEWFAAGMPTIIRSRKPVQYFTGVKEID